MTLLNALRRFNRWAAPPPPWYGPPVAPARPLRVLGLDGWVRWQLIERGPTHTSWRLDIRNETSELEDFGEV